MGWVDTPLSFPFLSSPLLSRFARLSYSDGCVLRFTRSGLRLAVRMDYLCGTYRTRRDARVPSELGALLYLGEVAGDGRWESGERRGEMVCLYTEKREGEVESMRIEAESGT